MKRSHLTVTVIILLLIIVYGSLQNEVQAAIPAAFAKDRIIVKFKNVVKAKRFMVRHPDRIVDSSPKMSTVVLRVPKGSNVEQQLLYYRNQDDVQFAEPDYTYRSTVVPNDTHYKKQWYLPTVQAVDAWDLQMNAKDVVIAVIDTGVAFNHPDLRDKVLEGYNFLESTKPPEDDNGHGTHVAGIIAASFHNQLGVSGLCRHCKIMPLKAMDSKGNGSLFDVATAVQYAVDNGAAIINMSLSGTSFSQSLQAAIDYAWSKGVFVVASAGNNSTKNPEYPAACENVLTVSAINSAHTLASFSNYGSYIDLTAPGSEIYSTFLNGTYEYMSGTSMAAPVVSGIAGSLLSQHPELKNSQLELLLKKTALDLGEQGVDESYGSGLVQATTAFRVKLIKQRRPHRIICVRFQSVHLR